MRDTWITLSGKSALQLELKSVQAVRGVGLGQLRFTLEATSKHEVSDGAPLWMSGRLSAANVGNKSGHLGQLNLENAPCSLPSGRGSTTLNLYADVSNAQLQIIEDNRLADVTFDLELWGYVVADGRHLPFWGNRLEWEVKQSDWINLLEQMDYRRILLIEVDASDLSRMPEKGQAAVYFKAAQKLYLEHEWRGTVESLRQCLAALVGESADEEQPETDVTKTLREVKNKARQHQIGYAERNEPIRQALKFQADLGAHPEVAETTKTDAHAMLLMVGGLLQGYRKQ